MKPLVRVDRHLRAQWLGQHQDVAGLSMLGADDLDLRTHGHGNAPNDGPRVEDRLAARDGRARLAREVAKTAHHLQRHNVASAGLHVARGGQSHEHGGAVRDAHRIQVAQHVGASDAALKVRICHSHVSSPARHAPRHGRTVHKRIEEIVRGNHHQAGLALHRHNGAVHPHTPRFVRVLAQTRQQRKKLRLRHLTAEHHA